MAQLAASIVSHDEEFKRQVSRLLRAGGVPVAIIEGRAEGTAPDVFVVDIRADASSGMAAIERLRAAHGSVAIFAIAASAEPDLILQAMRAGANEFFPWTPGGETNASRAMEESFHGAVRRTGARREAASAGSKQPCVTHVFLGAKGGAGTTTVAVNCAVELARLSKRPTVIVDLKPCLGEVALFLGVRPGSRCSTRSRTSIASTRTS
jgi:pilus assembly protein CpaE